MARTIVIPLDGSQFAEHALAAATGIARAEGSRLHLVRAHEAPVVPASPDVLVPYDGQWDAALRIEEKEYLQSVANRIAEQSGVSARTEVVDGPPAAAIATYAREMDIDLIVMTTHGRGGLSRMWLGSVADGVVRRSGVPVLLLRSKEDVDTEESVRPRHVLIPLDGSDLSTGVIEPAVWLGALWAAHFTLLRVVLPVPLIQPSLRRHAAPDSSAVNTEHLEHAREMLEEVARPLRERGHKVDVTVITHTVPAQGILDWAATGTVDLIALATHGRGGWTRLAVGSVADKVLRGSNVPVLVFRPAARPDGIAGSPGPPVSAYA